LLLFENLFGSQANTSWVSRRRKTSNLTSSPAAVNNGRHFCHSLPTTSRTICLCRGLIENNYINFKVHIVYMKPLEVPEVVTVDGDIGGEYLILDTNLNLHRKFHHHPLEQKLTLSNLFQIVSGISNSLRWTMLFWSPKYPLIRWDLCALPSLSS